MKRIFFVTCCLCCFREVRFAYPGRHQSVCNMANQITKGCIHETIQRNDAVKGFGTQSNQTCTWYTGIFYASVQDFPRLSQRDNKDISDKIGSVCSIFIASRITRRNYSHLGIRYSLCWNTRIFQKGRRLFIRISCESRAHIGNKSDKFPRCRHHGLWTQHQNTAKRVHPRNTQTELWRPSFIRNVSKHASELRLCRFLNST